MTNDEYEALVDAFRLKQIHEELERFKRAQAQREDFLKKYPISSVRTLCMEDYLFAKAGCGSGDTFCDWMYSKLEEVAHTGDLRPNMYGIYYRGGTELALSRTFEKKYGRDFQSAFLDIRSQVASLLEGVAEGRIKAAEECKLDRPFRYKLLAVYFPEKFLPICTSGMMQEACKAMGLSTSKGREMVHDNLRLVRMKHSHPSTKDWDNETFLGFCRWVGRERRSALSENESRRARAERAKRIDEKVESLQLLGEEKEAVVKLRVNQDAFRRMLLKRQGRCALCGVDDERLLVAGHIKPWSASEAQEKLDPDNGLMFCPAHDSLFDKGLISFASDGEILISSSLSEVNMAMTNIRPGMKIEISEGQEKYLAYHRDNVFQA